MSFKFEEWLSKNSNVEDVDSYLTFSSTEEGGVFISDNECIITTEGNTLEEACNNFTKATEEFFKHLKEGKKNG